MMRPNDKARQRAKLLKEYGARCAHCLSTIDESKLTIDHIIPTVAGGSNCYENLQLLCKSCNTRKKQKPDDYKIGQIHPDKGDLYVLWATAYGVLEERPLSLVLPKGAVKDG